MNFAVIDVEVVNNNVTSVATVGIVGVDKGKIIESAEYYIKPEPFEFDERMISINGLTENDFINAPSFSEIWGELSEWFTRYDFYIAHNALFDFGILKGCCNKYDLTYNDFAVLDSAVYAKNSNINLPNHKLNTLCQHLNISLCEHHNALCDAKATAEVMLKLIEMNNHNIIDVIIYSSAQSFFDIKERKNIGIVTSNKSKFNSNWNIHAKDVAPAKIVFDKENAFNCKKVVISGELTSMDRVTAYSMLKACGADVCDNVTLSTDYLITNSEKITGKIKKAKDYIERGQDIKIINENDFLKIIERAEN